MDKDKLLQFSNALDTYSTLKIPKAMDLIKKNFKTQYPDISDDYLKNIQENSPGVLSMQVQLDSLKKDLNLIASQIPLLATPVTITPALKTIDSLLPATLKSITSLGIAIPSTLEDLFTAYSSASQIKELAGQALIGPLSPVKSILGL